MMMKAARIRKHRPGCLDTQDTGATMRLASARAIMAYQPSIPQIDAKVFTTRLQLKLEPVKHLLSHRPHRFISLQEEAPLMASLSLGFIMIAK